MSIEYDKRGAIIIGLCIGGTPNEIIDILQAIQQSLLSKKEL